MTFSLLLKAPPGWTSTLRNMPSGANYQPDANGIVNITSTADIKLSVEQGFTVYTQQFQSNALIGQLLGANMNVTTDQPIPLFIPVTSLFRVGKVTVTNASLSLTSAQGGIYDGATKGGNAIVAAGQAYSALTTAFKCLDLTIAANLREPAATKLYFALTAAQGAAATADIYVWGDILTQ